MSHEKKLRISKRVSGLPVIGLLTLVYVIAGKFGLMLAFLQPSASPVWPPAGIALAALLVLGYRGWPAIFVGAFVVNVTTAGNVATSLVVASGNTLEAVCGAWLVNRFAGGTSQHVAVLRVVTVQAPAMLLIVAELDIGMRLLKDAPLGVDGDAGVMAGGAGK
jgi:integral membrane sensor domain MASE1